MQKALRMSGIALVAAIFPALWMIIRSDLSLGGKIVAGLFVAMFLILGPGALLMEETKFTFSVYRQETANKTSRPALLEELALYDCDPVVRRNAAAQVRDAGLAEKLILSSNDAEVCRACLPVLIRANVVDGRLSGRIGTLINASTCANTFRERPLCQDCYNLVTQQEARVQRYLYCSTDTVVCDEDDVFIEYICTHCGRASAEDFSITLDSLLPDDSQI